MRRNILKEKLYNGEVAFGPFLKINDPAVIEIFGHTNFDFAIIDMEHGPISVESAQNLIRAAETVGITSVVRVSSNTDSKILRVLDIGAQGIEVPQINTKAAAEDLVKAARFNPEGERGVCCNVRSADYSKINQTSDLKNNYFQKTNENNLIIAHIEGLEGVNNIDEIMDVNSIDVLFIGPYDLSQSLGIPGQVNDKRVEDKMQEIIDKASRRNKIVGTYVDDIKTAKKWIDKGVKFIAYSVDVAILFEKSLEIASQLRD